MENQHKKIGIIGLGWLGEPLAKHLQKLGYHIVGTCTSKPKCATLLAQGIEAHECLFPSQQLPVDAFTGSSAIIICIPPSKLKAEYIHVMRNLSEQLKAVTKLIFVSSTSVYADANSEVDESTPSQPQTESGQILQTCESFFLQQNQYVVRLAGLYGEGRYPGKWFAGKQNIPNGLAPVNMISLENCIQLFTLLIQQDIPNTIINGVETYHPSRMDFYTEKTKELNLPLPEFIPELLAWKKVTSKFIHF